VERPVTKKFSIRLFPEQNQESFYKIVYGGIFSVAVVLFLLRYTYNYLTRQQEINKQIELEAQKNDPVIKAWDYLYNQKNKTLHKLMDSAMIKKTANNMK